jgi:hypothetical protein
MDDRQIVAREIRQLASDIVRLSRNSSIYSAVWGPITNLETHLCVIARVVELNGEKEATDDSISYR